jgi:hypothetical protein
MNPHANGHAAPPWPEGPADHVAGLDLGQATDHTALAVLERRWAAVPGTGRRLPFLTVGHLVRWPLQTAYTAIAADLAALVRRPPLRVPSVAVDRTGVGAAVLEIIRQARPAARLVPVLITGGFQVTRDEDGVGWHIPKKDLVSTLTALLQSRRLRIAALPERALLTAELAAFRVRVTPSANETFEAWRERDHDDLVLAVAMAAWLASRPPPGNVVVGGHRPDLGPPPGSGWQRNLPSPYDSW